MNIFTLKSTCYHLEKIKNNKKMTLVNGSELLQRRGLKYYI